MLNFYDFFQWWSVATKPNYYLYQQLINVEINSIFKYIQFHQAKQLKMLLLKHWELLINFLGVGEVKQVFSRKTGLQILMQEIIT
jgi:hypothetical protein